MNFPTDFLSIFEGFSKWCMCTKDSDFRLQYVMIAFEKSSFKTGTKMGENSLLLCCIIFGQFRGTLKNHQN